jgi:hypothetical protein
MTTAQRIVGSCLGSTQIAGDAKTLQRIDLQAGEGTTAPVSLCGVTPRSASQPLRGAVSPTSECGEPGDVPADSLRPCSDHQTNSKGYARARIAKQRRLRREQRREAPGTFAYKTRAAASRGRKTAMNPRRGPLTKPSSENSRFQSRIFSPQTIAKLASHDR